MTFGKRLVRPLYYIGTYDQFVKKIVEEELMVLGYFDFTSKNPHGFVTYHQAALTDVDSGNLSCCTSDTLKMMYT